MNCFKNTHTYICFDAALKPLKMIAFFEKKNIFLETTSKQLKTLVFYEQNMFLKTRFIIYRLS